MTFKYRIYNAPSAATIDRASTLNCNWVIVHSAGIEQRLVDRASRRPMDMFPIYFEGYPKVAEVRHHQDTVWLEPMRREVRALCDRAVSRGLKVAFHMYEPTLPHVFEREYPDVVGIYRRPTQEGTWIIHSHLDPDNPETWKLLRSKYAELARDFPHLAMVILSTWDGAGSRWCIPKAKMPIHRRLVRMIEAATEGVRSVRDDCIVCLRLWGRNWPRNMYLDCHKLIERVTELKDATKYMLPTARPYNDPDEILPKVFEELAPDVPVMYKSTRFDIGEGQPLTDAAGAYPPEREQIIEVSFELYHRKPWPWCKVAHIRRGMEAARKHKLAGFLALPVNMGNNLRTAEPETGNLGRMNTWLFERIHAGDDRTDAELVSAWLEKEFDGPQPVEATEVLLEADDITDKGVQWGGGVTGHRHFEALHSTKLIWLFAGFIDHEFPYKMADPTPETIEGLISMKHDAHERARRNIERIKAARAAMNPRLFEELLTGYTTLADYILLARDWHSYLLMQYAIERKLVPADRRGLARMSRYVEQFIRNLVRLRDSDAVKPIERIIGFPDPFEV